MRFTAMFRYGLRALAVMAERYGQQPVSAKEISKLDNTQFKKEILLQEYQIN